MPTGTVTLLFSDIEESTRLWERAPDAMAVSLERHDQLVRAAIESCDGWIFKTVGDGFCASFSRPESALAAAAETQRAISSEPWDEATPMRVRIAIHTGACQVRDGDYFGPQVNRVARLEAVAHGGQVVVSRTTAELVGDSLASGLTLRDLGQHRLKDLERPEEVYQLNVDGLELTEFPPLRSLPEVRHNLPLQLTSFIGRTREIAAVSGLLDEGGRLVTLTGPGGCGKTRLALQVAAERLDLGSSGVWFVDLAPLRDGRFVPATVAAALSVSEEPERDVLETVATFIDVRPLLIVLDNCEHVIDECAKLVDRLLRMCPSMAVVATSREPLGVDGELVFRVPSLEVPSPDRAEVLASDVASLESVQLLVQRVHHHDPGFDVDDQNATAIASICRRLDGIPLAIELVAARMTMMSPDEIDRRLDDRFRLLTGGNRASVPRQQTLQASIDWSYDLLTPSQRAVLCRCSVFVGSFDLEAAEAVCPDDDVDEYEVVELVASLLDRSLLRSEPVAGLRRFGLSESVREYAARKLAEHGEDRVRATEERFAAHFVDRAERRDLPQANTMVPRSLVEERSLLDEVYEDGDNYLSALALVRRRGDPDSGLRLAYCVAEACWHERQFQEGVEHLTASVVGAEGDMALRARALFELGTFLIAQGQLAGSRARLDEARADALAAGRVDLALRVDHRRAYLGLHSGGDPDHRAVDDGIALAEQSGDPDLIAYARYVRGAMLAFTAPKESLEDLRHAAAHFLRRGLERCYWDCVADLASSELEAGNFAEAKEHLEGVLTSDVGLEPAYRETTYLNLAEVCLQLGERAAACEHWAAGAQLIVESRNAPYFVPTVLIAALCCSATGHPIEAAQLHGAASALVRASEEQFEPLEASLREADLERLATTLDAEVIERESANGARLSIDEAVAIATQTLGA